MSTDFTSSLFLGLRHAHADLPAWACLTTGRPPQVDRGVDRTLGARLARLLGTDDAVLRRSTLHGLLDTITALAGRGTVVVDDAAYPISHWAAGAATASGIAATRYRHLDADAAAAQCRRAAGPVVLLTDGWCSSCSRPAPLAALQAVATSHHGHLVIDDSLAVGVLGDRSATSNPFGLGGGGLPMWLGIAGPGPVVVSSLAKGFGTPLAVVAGPRAPLCSIRRLSETTIHASGPTAADRAALRSVLDSPRGALDARRAHLARLTKDLRGRLRRHGLRPLGLPFPFVLAQSDQDAVALSAELRTYGCRTMALSPRCQPAHVSSVLGVALRADHTRGDLLRLEDALAAAAPVRRETV